ncbi:MAG: enoyl-CoA hydratase/isomerase family protein [Burkholderiales bacterium]|nr:enoyl-CoA hydratase/isomerase family protein [Burkholderiales bacterium]
MAAQTNIVKVRLEDRAAGQVAYVSVDNATHRNRLGKSGKDDLVAAFTRLAANEHLRVAVLTGAGDKSFIAGSDLAEMQGQDVAGQREVGTKTHLACDAIRQLPVPVLARINGYCLGSGMELAAACDMRAAADHAMFGMPEVKFGLPSGMEACLLPLLLGWGKANEIVLTGEMIDAQEAYRCGFLQRLVPASDLDTAIEKWVSAICAAGARAVRLQKGLVRDWERMSIRDAIHRGIQVCAEARTTDEPARLMQAFIDRKKSR